MPSNIIFDHVLQATFIILLRYHDGQVDMCKYFADLHLEESVSEQSERSGFLVGGPVGVGRVDEGSEGVHLLARPGPVQTEGRGAAEVKAGTG